MILSRRNDRGFQWFRSTILKDCSVLSSFNGQRKPDSVRIVNDRMPICGPLPGRFDIG